MVAVIVAFYVVSDNKDKDRVEVWKTTPQVSDPDTAWRYGLDAEPTGPLRLGVLLALFAGLTAAAHVFYASSPAYPRWLAAGWNPGRWLEYAVTAALMVVIIGALDGSRTWDVLTLLAVATAATMAFGYTGERRLVTGVKDAGLDAVDWLASMVLFLGTWAVLGGNFFGHIQHSKAEAEDTSSSPPPWLWAVFISQFLFFSCFAGVRAYQAANPGVCPLKVEAAYTGLSLAAKSTLVALALGGLAA